MVRSVRAPLPRPSVLEALALLLIVAIAATFVAPQRFRLPGDRRATARSDMDAIGAALETYRHDTGRYPSTAYGLAALVTPPARPPRVWNWRGPYVLRPLPNDPWGAPYVYRGDRNAATDGYVLSSYGADGKPGGRGDDADVIVRR